MSRKFLKKTAMIVGGAAVGTGVVVLGVPAAVAALGFGSAGIAAGSTAAWLMSLSGGATQAGSIVAVCQSIGATGAVASSTGAIGTVVGGITGYFASKKKDQSNVKKNQKQCKEEQDEDSEEDEEQEHNNKKKSHK